jgi:hypothetical protein
MTMSRCWAVKGIAGISDGAVSGINVYSFITGALVTGTSVKGKNGTRVAEGHLPDTLPT